MRWLAFLLLVCGCTRLPDLPELKLGGALPAVRARIEAAHRDAARDPKAAGALGMVLHAHGFTLAAEQAYRRARATDPEKPEWAFYHAAVLDTLGRGEEAAQTRASMRGTPGADWLERVAALNETSFEWTRRGIALAQAARWPEAAAAFEKALERDERDGAARYNLIRAFGEQGRVEDAARQYQHAVRLDPNSVDAHFNWATVLARAGRLGEAEPVFARVVALQPTHADGLTNLGYCAEARNDRASAARRYREAIAADPQNTTAHFRLGRLLLASGQAGPAMEQFAQAGGSAEALYGSAIGARRLGRADASTLARQAWQAAQGSGNHALAGSIAQDFHFQGEP